MKIAYVASSEFPCPPPQNQIQAALWVASEVIEGMTKRGHHTIYIGTDTSTVKATEIVSMGKSFFDWFKYEDWILLPGFQKDQTLDTFQIQLQLFLIDTLRKYQVDLVHFHSSPPTFMLPFSRYISVPKIQTVHDRLYACYQPIFEAYQKIPSNYFVSISNAQQRENLSVSYIATVYNGIPVDTYPFREKPENELIFLGRIKQIKGVKDAVLTAQKVNIPLSIVGREVMNEKEYMDREIVPYIDGVHIKQLGVAGHNEKVLLLGKSKALLFPIQWDEPFGLVMLEAMACGTPVIAYNRGSVAEVVRDGLTGFIVDPDDDIERPGKGSWIIKKRGVEGFVEAVGRIAQIDRNVCRKHVVENFTTDRMVEEYEKVYKKILNSPSH